MRVLTKDSHDQSWLIIQASSVRYHRSSSTMLIDEFGSSYFYRVPGMEEEEYNKLLLVFLEKESLDLRDRSVVRMRKDTRGPV